MVAAGEELVRFFHPYREAARMPGMLMFMGMEKSRVYCVECLKGHACNCGGFWPREELIGLEVIASEAKKAYHEKARIIQTHLVENHEEAVQLTSTWAKIKKLFRKRGVFL